MPERSGSSRSHGAKPSLAAQVVAGGATAAVVVLAAAGPTVFLWYSLVNGLWRAELALAAALYCALAGALAWWGIATSRREAAERRRVEEALRQSETRARRQLLELEHIYNSTPVGLALMSPDLRFIRVNERLATINGRPAAEHPGRHLREIIPAIAPIIEPLYQRVIESGEPILDLELKGPNPRDPERQGVYLISYHPVEGDDGSLLGLSTVVLEITERKRAEEAILASEERYRRLFNASRDGIVFVDLEGRIETANQAFLDMVGRALDELCALPYARLSLAGGQPSGTAGGELPQEVPEDREEREETYLGEDGSPIPVLVRAWRVADDQGQALGTMRIVRDLTQIRRVEEERRKLEAKVQETQKLESLGILAGGIAHDFNNLLVGILGNADLALTELPAGSPVLRNVKAIETAARRLTELCNQLLAYSGRGTMVTEALDLNQVVAESADLIQLSASKKATLDYDLAHRLPAVEADTAQVQQILVNLITNASEAMGGEGGTIRVTTGTMECSRAFLDETHLGSELREGVYVYLEVADTGCGMEEEVRGRIFDPFFTTKFTGRGLGLAAVLGIVRGHRGAIRVDSAPGRGATIRVLFPSLGRPARPRPQPARPDEPWRGHGTVLLVDDEDTVCAVARRMVEKAGFEVLTASNGREAVDLFRQHTEEVVCAIVDLTMPQMDGEATFNELRRIRKDIPVILSSGYHQEAISHFAQGGLAGFLKKPYRYSELVAKLRQALP